MSLAVAVSPSLLHLPPDVVSSSGGEAIEFARDACGIELDPWQEWVVGHALSERVSPDGVSWAAFEIGLVTPRQNGKNFILETIQLAALYLFGDMTLVHSAHKFDTSVEHFNRIRWLFENTPELSALLLPGDRSFVTSNGKEHIRLNTGQRLLFKARYRGASRGFVGDKVFLDEAFDISPSAMGATIPTLSTRPGAQVYYTSSAPHESSQVLHAVRSRALNDDPLDRLFYAEWGNPVEALELDANDPAFMDAIRTANPAVQAGRITEEYILQEIRTFSGDAELVEEHRRERLGVPSMPYTGQGSGPIDIARWAELADSDSKISGEVSTAIDVSPDLKWATIASAGSRSDGHVHVEIGRRQPGTDWIVPFAVANPQHGPYRVVGGSSPGAFLLPLLEDAGVWTIDVPAADAARATQRLIASVDDGTIHHLGSNEIAAALSNATIKPYGDSQTWSRIKSSGDISALVAATVAVGGVRTDVDPIIRF